MLLSSDRYESIKYNVLDFIKKYQIFHYPLDCFDVCNKLNVHLIKYSDLSEKSLNYLLEELNYTENVFIEHESDRQRAKNGFLFIENRGQINQKYHIAYNDYEIYSMYFTIYHEIGHIGRNHKVHSKLADEEADWFAAYLCAPNILIEESGVDNYIDLANKFNLSKDSAKSTFSRYLSWKNHTERKGLEFYDKEIQGLCDIK